MIARGTTIVAAAAIGFLISGFCLTCIGVQMPRYHDKEAYQSRYSELARDHGNLNRTKEFHALREHSLTASYSFQDYGITAALTGVLLLLGSRSVSLRKYLPRRKFTVAALGLIAAYAVFKAEVLSLEMDFFRGEFPMWADSIGIPLSGMPIIFAILAVWASIHALLVPNKTGRFERLNFRRLNWWLPLMIGITLLYLVLNAASGYFWPIIPSALWIVFYLSIWMRRSEDFETIPAEI